MGFEPNLVAIARGLATHVRETRCRCALLRKWLRVNDEEAFELIHAALMAAYHRGVMNYSDRSNQEAKR